MLSSILTLAKLLVIASLSFAACRSSQVSVPDGSPSSDPTFTRVVNSCSTETSVPPPRYYDKLFKRLDDDAYESMKFLREVDAKSGDQSDSTPERLAVRAAVAAALPKLKNRSI